MDQGYCIVLNNVSEDSLVKLQFNCPPQTTQGLSVRKFIAFLKDSPNTPIVELSSIANKILRLEIAKARFSSTSSNVSFIPFKNSGFSPIVDFITNINPGLGRTNGRVKVYSIQLRIGPIIQYQSWKMKK